MTSKRRNLIAIIIASGVIGLASVSVIHNANGRAQIQIAEPDSASLTRDQSQQPKLNVSDSKILVKIGNRATLKFPSGSRVLTERNTDQGGVSVSNIVVEAPLSEDKAMKFVEDTLRSAGQTPEVVRTDQVKAINIRDIKTGFRAGIAFEAVSDKSTVVLVNVFDRQ